jgi:chemotaxis protein CheX
MEVAYINPFIEAVTVILRMTTNMEVTRGTPSLDKGNFHAPEVCVSLGIVGDKQGHVVYGISMETALNIAGRMMGGVEVKELDDLAKSAIAELGNMITGNASSRFEKMAINLDISPPTVMVGQKLVIGWPMHTALVVPIHTEAGELVVWVSLAEKKN